MGSSRQASSVPLWVRRAVMGVISAHSAGSGMSTPPVRDRGFSIKQGDSVMMPFFDSCSLLGIAPRTPDLHQGDLQHPNVSRKKALSS
ncbi:hypothetical protein V500_03966 [Pseudogymnoascus sp. VKM F-4518 (FW-2643)]|nr:hypothetical protein V500_03966 [Pseudogymnoascus sp. VKM F-4518 (FW-2643)]